ncbi:glycoside hydrolase family 32 protein [Sediminicola sp. 1XM1-17]|uniref:glycoside hydrolase family 32 protein n=1 Tax=Sediminicola sp. 1XM1-17 TaxID=3127702 RepID=UPI0030777066
MEVKKVILAIAVLGFLIGCKNKTKEPSSVKENSELSYYQEPYRPQFHFTPEKMWMNDPNGLVYHKGLYHLFYQYYPEDTVWGPMHWGHAVSKDMMHWEHRPIALFPDEHGLIFSGSAVVDVNNTSGFGSPENPALVAIFTYHLMEGEEAGRKDFQTQGIAYSLDNGDTWTKYTGNPVIENTGIRDFRDPKVFWNDKANKWTMLLVAGDHLQIWESPNLIDWQYTSEFGRQQGAHGGVWECPDLFPLEVEGTTEKKWVLLISINPGAPNGGSGTQYFIGDFDGSTFTSDQQEARWIDLGRDNYAGVTYNNVPNEDRIFIGWMSNWDYARDTPTEKWRSAMTLPRKLSLRKVGSGYGLFNFPLEGFDGLVEKAPLQKVAVRSMDVLSVPNENLNQSDLMFKTGAASFQLIFTNDLKEKLVVVVDRKNKMLILNRANSGRTGFHKSFPDPIQKMPLSDLPSGKINFRIIMDWSSLELFVNDGQHVMTTQLFPTSPYNNLVIKNMEENELQLEDFQLSKVKSIW